MARLPNPGADEGQWGEILNDFLTQTHNTNGTLKNNVVTGAKLNDGTVTEAKLSSAVQAKLNSSGGGTTTIADGSVTTVKLADNSVTRVKTSTAVQASLSKADTALQSAPVASVSGKTGAVTLVKADVGLTNVDNTSDLAKPISTATQSALNAKVSASSLAAVATSGDYTDLTGTPTVPTNLGDLGNVTTTGAANGQVLKYNGSIWSPASDLNSGTGGTSDPTDLSNTVSATTVTVASSTGASTTLPSATTANAGVMSAADKTKLGGIATGAQVNTVTSVATKTGAVTLVKADVGLTNVDNTSDAAKPISTATQTALDAKAGTSHSHALDDLTNVTATNPTSGQVLKYNGTNWAPATDSTGGGGGGLTAVSATADITASAGNVIIGNAATAGFTVTLPVPTNGAQVTVKKVDNTNNAILVFRSGVQIDDQTSISVNNQWQSQDLFSDGTKWYRV